MKKGNNMKTLIVEDEFTSRLILQEILSQYGSAHIAVNGKEAVEAVRLALDAGNHYDLICLDIMMPEMDGHEALRKIREQEEAKGIPSGKRARIVMTTAAGDLKNVITAFKSLCNSYLTKPVEKAKLLDVLRTFQLIT
jgi:two-component system, chemotaxis family, chemotaxis protein CheY